METARQLLGEKGHEIWSVSPDAPVLDAIKSMAEHGCGALLVMDADKLVGIISERDYARKVILKGKASNTTPVREIMSDRVVCAAPTQLVHDCMTLMTEKRIRHLPVVDDGRVLGVLSIGDLVRSIIADQQGQIEQLEHYIAGG